VRHRAVYWLGRLGVSAAALLPQWLGYPAAAALGRLWFRCSRRRRAAALRFLGNAFPSMGVAERLRLARVATGNVFKVPLDMARLTRLLARGGDVREVVDASALNGLLPSPPYLALTAHLGSWEVAAATMARLSGEAHGVARTFRNPLLQRWILRNRQRGGLHVHPRRGGIQGLAAALRRGAVGLQVVDQHQRLRGVVAPFFGEDASCERAAASLALRAGYPILVGYAQRVGGGFRFRMVAHPPFVPAHTGDRAFDLRQVVVEINRRLEEQIRGCPEQYLWIHERYRSAPRLP
jgi:KDO2-lipid IV(A) lauroyltransferase